MGIQRHGHLSGAHQVRAAAGIGRLFQDVAAGSLRHTQHFGRQRRDQLVAIARHHGNFPDNGIPLECEADKAGAGGLCDLRNRRQKAARLHHRQQAVADD